MTSTPRDFSPAFHESVQLLVQLHHEMTTGDPDGEKADEIRDAMEWPWDAMSEAERKLVRGLSADLYTIGHPWEAAPEIPAEVGQAVMDALGAERWEELFDALRTHERLIPPDGVAYLRGFGWLLLGYPEAAIEFLEEAINVSPIERVPYIYCFVQTLVALGRTEQAMHYAQRIALESDDPLLLLNAAEVFFVRSTEVDGTETELILQKARETADRGLNLAEQAEQTEALISQSAVIHLWIALNYARLNNIDAANDAVAKARRLVPNQPFVLFVEAFLRQKSGFASWDQGVGQGLIRLRGVPTDALRFGPDLISVHT